MAHLLVIELPGGNDTDILEAAHARGDAYTFLTADLAHYLRQPGVAPWIARACAVIEVSPFIDEVVMQRISRAHAERPFDAVLCLIDIRVREAAQIARRLGLRHLNPRSAELLRDKYEVRRRLAACGIAQPDFALADSNERLRAAVGRLGLPVLIKPADGYGSQNIVVLTAAHELDPLLTPLDDMLPSRADYGLGVLANDRLLVERFMQGQVIGCDTLTYARRHRLLGIHEKQFFAPPSFAIRGGTFTPNSNVFSAIEDYLFSVLDVLDFDWGAAHTEIMLTAAGPRLIEVNPRLVGAKIPRLVSLGLGASVHDELIALHTGERAQAFIPSVGRVAVSRWVVAPREGVLSAVHAPAMMLPDVCCTEWLKKPGDVVRPPFENADRLGYVMACAGTAEAAVAAAEAFIEQCSVVVDAAAVPATRAA